MNRSAFRLVVAVLVWLSGLASAQGVADQGAPRKAPEGIVSCATSIRGSITVALTCADRAVAMEQLDEAGCFVPNAPAVVEVRRVWLARESLEETAAARDPTVQLFMAGCLVEAHSKTRPPDEAEVSAVAFLRGALRGPDPSFAGPAMMKLGPVLNQDDIEVIVRIGSAQPNLVMPAVTTLSLLCTAEGKAGVAAIQAAVVGS